MSAPSVNHKLNKLGISPRDMTLYLHKQEEVTQQYCPYCMTGLFRSKFTISDILYGELDEELVASSGNIISDPISSQCRGCGTIYHQQILFYPTKKNPKRIKMFLPFEDIPVPFSCIFCKQRLFITQRRIVIKSGDEVMTMSEGEIKIDCLRCETEYFIEGFNK